MCSIPGIRILFLVCRIWVPSCRLWSFHVQKIRMMRVSISGLNKLFENRIRLGIMSVLMVNDSYDFNNLKETLRVTDGNLASHLKALEENDLIKVNKQIIGTKH